MRIEQRIYTIGLSDKCLKNLRRNFKYTYNYTNSIDFCVGINNNNPDIIIVDSELKDYSALDLIRLLRENIENNNIPIIFISSVYQYENIDKILKYKVNKFLLKDKDIIKKLKYDILDIYNTKKPNYIILENGYVWDKDLNTLFCNIKNVGLTFHEEKLTELLINNKNRTINNEDIFFELYMNEDKEYNNFTIRNLIRSIRKKSYNNLITSVYGVGYKIVI